ncbi:alpha/beta fold hydrolase [Streptomyces varsoviensis]|uniref:Beta-lactamase n=1 Tax=Streptomyces varsoviensis TaxID=67373 RepID=A0ABR5J204_9ACTN|nr:alpha/beta hydrolase [Streptomyces varsoviensis]KOG87389.1 beta-lactamase [Streptomyces varsoviensis]
MFRATIDRRRPALRASAALALLALTAGAVTACDGHGSAARRPPSAHTVSSATGRAGAAELHMIENAGHRLAFHVTPGRGATVVLDAGGGEDSSYWNGIVPRLHEATGATVITYDRAGLGKSDAVPGPWRVKSAVSDLEAGLRQLGVTGNVTLVSHSQAGEIATYFARNNPKLLSGAVLVDASLPPLYTDEEIARLVALNRPQVEEARKDPDEPRNRQLLAIAASYVPMHRAYHRATWPDSVPATVLVSEKTPFDGSPEDVRRWLDAAASFAQDGPGRRLVTARGSSHDIPKDRPGLVLKEVEKMVAAHH